MTHRLKIFGKPCKTALNQEKYPERRKIMEISGNVWKMEHEVEPEESFPSENSRDQKLHFVKKEQTDCKVVCENDTMGRVRFCPIYTK